MCVGTDYFFLSLAVQMKVYVRGATARLKYKQHFAEYCIGIHCNINNADKSLPDNDYRT